MSGSINSDPEADCSVRTKYKPEKKRRFKNGKTVKIIVVILVVLLIPLSGFAKKKDEYRATPNLYSMFNVGRSMFDVNVNLLKKGTIRCPFFNFCQVNLFLKFARVGDFHMQGSEIIWTIVIVILTADFALAYHGLGLDMLLGLRFGRVRRPGPSPCSCAGLNRLL